MQDIVGNACHPPVECHNKTAFNAASHSADYDIGQGTICPKQKTVKPGQNGKHQHGVLFFEEQHQQCQCGPDIQIHNDPHIHTVDTHFNQDKHQYGINHLQSEKQTEHDNPEGNQLHVGHCCQRQFADLDYCRHHTNQCNIPYTYLKWIFFLFHLMRNPILYISRTEEYRYHRLQQAGCPHRSCRNHRSHKCSSKLRLHCNQRSDRLRFPDTDHSRSRCLRK